MSDSEGGGKKIGKTYPNVCITRPTVNKPTLLRFQGELRDYESKSWAKDIASYLSWDFALFQEREIATGGKAIREQLAGLDLQIILDHSYIEWKKIDMKISILLETQTKFHPSNQTILSSSK